MMRYILMMMMGLALVIGCTKTTDDDAAQDGDNAAAQEEQQDETDETSLKEDVQSVVDAAIGVQAIEQGEKAKDKVRRLNEERNRQIDEYSDF